MAPRALLTVGGLDLVHVIAHAERIEEEKLERTEEAVGDKQVKGGRDVGAK